MSIPSDMPQIAVLKLKVEECFGKHPLVHTDFLELVSAIEVALKEHVSESTLERLWGYSTRENEGGTVSVRTLDVLARFCGLGGWEGFCARLKAEQRKESDLFSGKTLRSSELAVGARVLIGWQPDRLCTVRYLGDNLFEVESAQNTSLSQGDRFKVLQFQLGRPMYLEEFRPAPSPATSKASQGSAPFTASRTNSSSASSSSASSSSSPTSLSATSSVQTTAKTTISGTYAVGQEHGLTTLKLL